MNCTCYPLRLRRISIFPQPRCQSECSRRPKNIRNSYYSYRFV